MNGHLAFLLVHEAKETADDLAVRLRRVETERDQLMAQVSRHEAANQVMRKPKRRKTAH